MNILFSNAFHATLSVKGSVKGHVEVPKLFDSENQHSNFCQNIIIRRISKTLLFCRWGIRDAKIKWCLAQDHAATVIFIPEPRDPASGRFPLYRLRRNWICIIIIFLPKKKTFTNSVSWQKKEREHCLPFCPGEWTNKYDHVNVSCHHLNNFTEQL